MNQVNDLRSVLELLKTIPGQLVETDVEVDPAAELSGVYRYVGAGGTVQRPTKVNGPAMIFNNIKGFPDAKVAIGVLGSRNRVAALFNCKSEDLGETVVQMRRESHRADCYGKYGSLSGNCSSGK